MHASENTQITPRISWFWAGAGSVDPRTGHVWRWAKGYAHSQLEASRYVHCFNESLKICRQPDRLSGQSTTEQGSFGICVTTLDIYHYACRELGDDCPWIVPTKSGAGVLYAVGFEPSIEELREIRRLAGLQ